MTIHTTLLVTIINTYIVCSTMKNAMALSSLSNHKESATKTTYEFSKIFHITATSALKQSLYDNDETRNVKCELCPEPELDLDLDRQEATFAALGHLWATITQDISIVSREDDVR
jgi:hypothetical protein